MIKKPVIGISLDSREGGEYAEASWYAIRNNYSQQIIQAGGLPVFLAHDIDLIPAYLSLVQGILVPGGKHDINPPLYGVQNVHPTITLNPSRTHFELALVKAALDKNIPVLGICGGLQVLNVALGGTLIQHIPDEVPGALNHAHWTNRSQPLHEIKILENTLLRRLIQKTELPVNSAHHQAVKTPGHGVVVNAYAPDGVIEGIEAPAYTFCLGVQWHPEYSVTPEESLIFKAFIEAA